MFPNSNLILWIKPRKSHRITLSSHWFHLRPNNHPWLLTINRKRFKNSLSLWVTKVYKAMITISLILRWVGRGLPRARTRYKTYSNLLIRKLARTSLSLADTSRNASNNYGNNYQFMIAGSWKLSIAMMGMCHAGLSLLPRLGLLHQEAAVTSRVRRALPNRSSSISSKWWSNRLMRTHQCRCHHLRGLRGPLASPITLQSRLWMIR